MADANTRPKFFAPFPAGTAVALKSYVGHNPDHKKMDIYAANWPGVVAAAPGVVHETFYPGGVEVRHFIPGTDRLGNWYTTYMHMSSHVPVGTRLAQGQRLGTAGSVGTGVKHLHHEQLHDGSGSGDADTSDMVFPAFVEFQNDKAFSMPIGEPGVRFVSKNRFGHPGSASPAPKPQPHKPGEKLFQRAPVPAMIRDGSGHYFGLKSGPANSHGGATELESHYVRMINRRLIVCGFVPGIKNPKDKWADRDYDKWVAAAVARFQKRYMPATRFPGQIWADDWRRLFNLP